MQRSIWHAQEQASDYIHQESIARAEADYEILKEQEHEHEIRRAVNMIVDIAIEVNEERDRHLAKERLNETLKLMQHVSEKDRTFITISLFTHKSICIATLSLSLSLFSHLFIHSSIHSFIHSFIHTYIHSFIHTYIHSFIYLSI